MQRLLDRIPRGIGNELAATWLKTVFRRNGILVQPIPLLSKSRRLALWNMRQKSVEFGGGNSGRKGLPAVTVAEQHDEIRPHSSRLTAADLAQADLHGLLVERSLVAHAPTEVDGLE